MKHDTLKALKAFIVWKYEIDKSGKTTKVPYCGNEGWPIGTTEKYYERLTDYRHAEATYKFNKKEFDGVGFVFVKVTDTLYICGIDIDHADPKSKRVKAIIALFPNAYIETSPSGDGVHIVMLVDITRVPQTTDDGKQKLDTKYYVKNEKAGLECYIAGLTARYFTFTGNMIQDGQDVDQTDELLKFLDLCMLRNADGESQTDAVSGTPIIKDFPPSVLSDEEIIQKLHTEVNGAKFGALFDSGDLSGYNGDDSGADMGLMNKLAFYTRCDRDQMERVFSLSALARREKWQSRGDYRAMTINRAIKDCKQVYEPPQRATAQSDFSEWREPTPLDTITPPEFPLDCFPLTIGEYARELSEYTQTDPAMAGVSCLGVLGGVFQNKIAVQSVNGNIEQTSIYAVKICAPAERKSEVDRHATRPIIKFAKQYNAEHSADISRSRAEFKLKQKALAAAEKDKNGDIERLFRAQEDIDNFKEVTPLTLVADDTTIEALISLMKDNSERMLIASDEGGIFSHMKGRYKLNGDDIEIYLKAHSGGRVSVHRKCREAETLENPALSLCISVQPYIAENAILDDENTGRGLTARLVFAHCNEKAGTRDAVSNPMTPAVAARYEQAIEKCLSRTINNDIIFEADYNTVNIVKLSGDAREYAIQYFDICEKRILDGLERAKGWNGKCFGLAIRIAGLFHAFECMERGQDPAEIPIPLYIMQNAAKLTEVLAVHAEKVFTGTDRKNNLALYLLKRLLGLLGTNSEINKQELFQRAKRRFENVETFDEALKTLETSGYIRIKQQQTKGRPLTTIEVNPICK